MDLDSVGADLLRNWARVSARLQQLDTWIDANAPELVVDAEGNVPGCMGLYATLANSERLAPCGSSPTSATLRARQRSRSTWTRPIARKETDA